MCHAGLIPERTPDPYRVFHGRERHTGYDRIPHTLWAWSNMTFGLPCPSDLVSARRPHPQHR